MIAQPSREARVGPERELELHLELRGEGPSIVLQHGFGGSARNFRPQARALGRRFRFVLFDARGHARSPAPHGPGSYTAERFTEDLAGVLGRVGLARAVVGGLSMGAGIALRFALERTERVRGLVLAAFPPGATGAREGARRQGAWALAFADAIDARGLAAAGAEFAWGPRSGLDPAAANLVRQGFLEHAPHAIAGMLRECLAVQPSAEELAPTLRRLEVPTLLVVGSEDRVSRGASEVLARELPRARLVVVPDAGHVVNLAAPAAFDAALAEFMDGLRAE